MHIRSVCVIVHVIGNHNLVILLRLLWFGILTQNLYMRMACVMYTVRIESVCYTSSRARTHLERSAVFVVWMGGWEAIGGHCSYSLCVRKRWAIFVCFATCFAYFSIRTQKSFTHLHFYIFFSSSSLSSAFRNYAQIKREIIAWAAILRNAKANQRMVGMR